MEWTGPRALTLYYKIDEVNHAYIPVATAEWTYGSYEVRVEFLHVGATASQSENTWHPAGQ